MKIRIRKLLILFFVFALGAISCYGSQKIWKKYRIYRDEQKIEMENRKITEEYSRNSKVIPQEKGEWARDNALIAHAGGGVGGATYTNAKEALETAVQNGFKIIEVDFLETEDGKIVLGHEWEDILTKTSLSENQGKGLTYDEYMKYRVEYRFSTVDINDLIEFMRENRDVYIVTDVKFDEENKEVLLNKIYEEIYKATVGNQEILNRFIVQVYDEESCEIINRIYEFPEKIYTLYHYEQYNYEAMALLCLKYNIPVVTIQQSAPTPSMSEMEILHSRGIKVYVHTINSLIDVQNWFDKGGDGVYTDWILPEDLELLNGIE